MKTRGKTLVPRNPFAVAAHRRKAGAHERTHKAQRHHDRQMLRRDLNKLLDGDKKGGGSGFALPSFLAF